MTLCILLISLQWQNLSADFYKWVDDKGAVHYGDNPPEKARLKNISGTISSFTTVDVEKFKFDPKLITTGEGAAPSVVMYSTTWCGYCKKAVAHFKQKNIKFKEYDIEKSSKGKRDYKKLRGRGVPIILIGGQRMNGFSAQAFDSIYYGKS